MFENLDMAQLAKTFEQVQENAKKVQEENESKEFTAKSGGGLIKVTLNGKSEVTDLDIDDSLLEDKESLQILLISAINDAIKMVEDNKKVSAAQLLGGLGGMNPFGNAN